MSEEAEARGFPIKKRIKIGLRTGTPSAMTPDILKQQLTDVGLTCSDSDKGKLEDYIRDVRGRLPSGQVESWLIARKINTMEAVSSRTLPSAHRLIRELATEHPVAMYFISTLASGARGTQDFVDQFVAGDETAQRFVASVMNSAPEARSFVERVQGTARGKSGFLAEVAKLGSGRLDFLAQLTASGLQPAAVGNWIPGDRDKVGEFDTMLEVIQNAKNFDILEKKFGDRFAGKKAYNEYFGKFSTVEAVKELFVTKSLTASSTLVDGLSEPDAEAKLTNVISPLQEANAKDYTNTDSLVLFLVTGYDPDKEEAGGVGVLTVEFDIRVKDYRKKSKSDLQHDTALKIGSRSVLYTDPSVLERDFTAVAPSGGRKDRGFPIKPREVKIFTDKNLPPASADTFKYGVPLKSGTEAGKVIILYAPDLQNIGVLDNTKSDATASYAKSVATGFTFTATQGISVETSIEASAEIIKVGVTVGFSLTFSEEWSTVTTETITYEAPPGKKVFAHQGFLRAAVLNHWTANNTYSYDHEKARCLTNVLVTTNTPLTAS